MELLGHRLQKSQETAQNIEELVQQVESLGKEIRGPRPPNPALKKSFEQMLEKSAKSRGRALFYPYIGTGIGRGPYVELEDGSVKLDLIIGIGVHLFGHSYSPLLKAALRGALSDITNQGNLQPNKEYVELGDKLVALASKNSRLKHAWLTTCGSRANEKALKLARQKNSPRKMVIAMERAFAGRTTMMAEITDNPEYKQGLPAYNEVLRIPFLDKKDPASAEKSLRAFKDHLARHGKDIAAFMFEIVQGEGGFRAATREYLLPMLELCRENKIAVWVDEIQTFSRTGELFAFETLGIGEYVDICTVAKVLQVAATLYTEDYNPKPGLIAGTFSGSSAALSTSLEVLNQLMIGNYFGANGKVAQLNKKFTGMLQDLERGSCKDLLEDSGGLGLMIATTPFGGNKDKVQKLLKVLFENGLISFGCGRDPYRIRFLAPMILEDQDIQVAKEILEKSLLQVAKEG
ncbi:MAG: aminotransferase class III-fold pyridoxal phosphate-dependent enzyme [Bdellovibrionales bacterium]